MRDGPDLHAAMRSYTLTEEERVAVRAQFAEWSREHFYDRDKGWMHPSVRDLSVEERFTIGECLYTPGLVVDLSDELMLAWSALYDPAEEPTDDELFNACGWRRVAASRGEEEPTDIAAYEEHWRCEVKREAQEAAGDEQ
jgi:hypothetical protein